MTPQQKRVEILVVGNELLNGTTLDINSFWLSKELAKMGFKIERKTTVGDELRVISTAFRQLISRKPDWIFSLGGLGPTFDDMTSRGLAVALGKKLRIDREAVGMLNESYKQRSRLFKRPARKLAETRLKMATIPEGSKPLRNPVGSAPGILAEAGKTHIVSLPGVPSEMKSIFSAEVVHLLKKSSQFFNAERWIKVTGIWESQLSPVVTRAFKKYEPLLYIKSHPSGFERGLPLIRVQIILTAPRKEKKAALSVLGEATRFLGAAAKKMGGSVSEVKSVR